MAKTVRGELLGIQMSAVSTQLLFPGKVPPAQVARDRRRPDTDSITDRTMWIRACAVAVRRLTAYLFYVFESRRQSPVRSNLHVDSLSS
jgi:hypothetical protein